MAYRFRLLLIVLGLAALLPNVADAQRPPGYGQPGYGRPGYRPPPPRYYHHRYRRYNRRPMPPPRPRYDPRRPY